MFGLFDKKEKVTLKEPPKKVEEEIIEESIEEESKELNIKPIRNKKEEYITTQCIEMGMDIKESVEKSSKAFFQSKNEEKAKAYSLFNNYMHMLEKYQKDDIQNINYLEFKEKEEQIYTKLKTGFSQYLSKGKPLDEQMRRTINLVFSDIKKLPSKAHRFWYYKIYIWQEAKTSLNN